MALVLLRRTAVAVLFVLAFEALARTGGWLDRTERPDPYQGFPGTSPLYRVERGDDGVELLRRSPNKPNYNQASFAAEKPAGEFRVFCIGGSSVRSVDFIEPDATFPGMLEVYLRARLPGQTVRVVNSGGGGTGSVQNLEVVREVLEYQPDLLIVYPEGGEKNLIPPSPQGVMAKKDDAAPLRPWARSLLARLRLYHGIRELYQRVQPARREASAPSAFSQFVLAAIARPFAPDTFTRFLEFKKDRVPPLMPHAIAPDEIQHAHARFQRNLAEMARLARERGVAILFVLPVRNVKASFYLRFHVDPAEIQPGRLDEWREHYAAGVEAKRQGRYPMAVERLSAARACYVDDQDEILAFYLGECFEQLGRFEEARAEYEKPLLRHPMRGLIRAVAEREGVTVIDPLPALAALAPHGIAGYEWFTDAFHPMPATNHVIAKSVLDDAARAAGAASVAPERIAQAESFLDALEQRHQASRANQMLRAIESGDCERAIRIAEALPETKLVNEAVIEALYYGWALTRKGDLAKARVFYAKLRAAHSANVGLVPPLDTDEQIVTSAFGGDLFSWF